MACSKALGLACCYVVQVQISHETRCSLFYSTRWLTQLREWILGTHYMLKNLNFNLIRFFLFD